MCPADTYLSKTENEKLDFAQFPSEELIRKLAVALEADEVEEDGERRHYHSACADRQNEFTSLSSGS